MLERCGVAADEGLPAHRAAAAARVADERHVQQELAAKGVRGIRCLLTADVGDGDESVRRDEVDGLALADLDHLAVGVDELGLTGLRGGADHHAGRDRWGVLARRRAVDEPHRLERGDRCGLGLVRDLGNLDRGRADGDATCTSKPGDTEMPAPGSVPIISFSGTSSWMTSSRSGLSPRSSRASSASSHVMPCTSGTVTARSSAMASEP